MPRTTEQLTGQACFWCGQSLAGVAAADLVTHDTIGVTFRSHRACDEAHKEALRTFEADELQRWRETGDFSQVRCSQCTRGLQETPRAEIIVDRVSLIFDGDRLVSRPVAYHRACWEYRTAQDVDDEPNEPDVERPCAWCEDDVAEDDEVRCDGCDALLHPDCVDKHAEVCDCQEEED
jgi:hypothetical protein